MVPTAMAIILKLLLLKSSLTCTSKWVSESGGKGRARGEGGVRGGEMWVGVTGVVVGR